MRCGRMLRAARARRQAAAPLFDHLVRALQQRLRDFQTERLRGLEVDDQLELGGLLDWQLARLRAPEDLVHIDGAAPVEIVPIRGIAHQAASLHVIPRLERRGQPVHDGEFSDALSFGQGEGEASTRTACARSRAMAEKAPASSAPVRAPTACSCTRSVRPASSSALSPGVWEEVSGFQRTAIRLAAGTTEIRSSRHLGPRSVCRLASPVMFPPGLAGLATWPVPSGSACTTKTMGIEDVAAFAGCTNMELRATIRSTLSRTKSAASSGSRAALPSASRNSIRLF